MLTVASEIASLITAAGIVFMAINALESRRARQKLDGER
jgi:hypothetical protein